MEEEKAHTGITILGLGPGKAELLTREAWDWLEKLDEIYLRTSLHPVTSGLPASLQVHSFDDIYQANEDFHDVYEEIIERILELGKRPEGVTYAVPGHPMVAEATCPAILDRARDAGIAVHIIEGISFLGPVFTALELDPFNNLTLVDALELGSLHVPPFPPADGALIAQIYSRFVASEVKMTLSDVYTDDHPVRFIHNAGDNDQLVEDIPLYAIDRSIHIGLRSALYVPPLGEDYSFEKFQEIIARLRAPDGCPWDRKQTHLSLRRYLVEETYEALDALDQEDTARLQEELGDLLLQILLHAQIATEDGEFNMAEVLKSINQKIIRRHPHVFGDVHVENAEDVLVEWERVKADEREARHDKKENRSLLDSVPVSMPALSQAQELQDRAARVGFDWSTIQPVLDKVIEEVEEFQQASLPEEKAGELGDLLFAVVNLVRWNKTDAESALRQTNNRFRHRFAYIERAAAKEGRKLSDMTLAEMDELWEQAKGKEEE
jgi:tetrapyrrole methylase family protein/MazG family protein